MPARPASRVWAFAALLTIGACAHAPPKIGGAASTPPGPSQPWRAPRGVVPPERRPATGDAPALPSDVASRADRLTLSDAVDLALRNNPQTTLSWAQAQSAAASYGASHGAYLPMLDATSPLARNTSPTQLGDVTRTQVVPQLTLSYLLFDFGARSGTVAAARANAIALDLTHNATLQNVALAVESAYFALQANRGLVAAESLAVAEADTNLVSAQQRHDAGVATIADVLQARTLLAQVQLDYETAVGSLQAARGNLAVAMGLPANSRFDVAPTPDSLQVGIAAASVDSLIDQALVSRPDLAAARVSIEQARAQVRVARSALAPSLTVGGSFGRSYNIGTPSGLGTQFTGPTYGVTIGLSLPLFNGFARQYQVTAAQANVQAASARADVLRTQVEQEVFNDYHALQTATQRVRTADVLLRSATESEQVALGRYRAGVGTIVDLLTAQSALASARAQQAQTRWTWATSLAQLAHDVGVIGLRGQTPIPLTADTTRTPR